MSVLCAHCGSPIISIAPNRVGEQFYHGGDCMFAAFPPEHPEQWPDPPFRGISRYSHDERVRDGLEQP